MSSSNDMKERIISDVNLDHTASEFKRPSYKYVLPVIFLYFLILFGIFPLTSQVHIDQTCKDLNDSDCESSDVAAKASTLNLIASFSLSIPSILTCGIYGSIADVYGRKIVMLVPFIGLIFYTAAYLFVDTVNPSSYVAIIVAGNFIMGLSGGYFTFIMACMCYVSDATALSPHSRRHVYSMTEATIFVPQVFAPVITGIWATYYGFFVPLVAGIVVAVIAVINIILLPESLPLDAESRRQPLKLSPFQTFTSIIFLFTYKHKLDEALDESPMLSSPAASISEEEVIVVKSKTERSPLPIMGMSFFIYFMALLGKAAVFVIYAKNRFGWDSGVIGIYSGLEGLVVSLSMIFGSYVAKRVFGAWGNFSLMTWIQIGYFFR